MITNFYLLLMYYYNSSPWCNITNFNHVIYFDFVKEKSHFSVMTQNHIHCHWPHCIIITVHNQNLSWQYCKISLILFSQLSFYIYLLIIHKKEFWNFGLQNFFFGYSYIFTMYRKKLLCIDGHCVTVVMSVLLYF